MEKVGTVKKRVGVTAQIPCRNNEDLIRDCLASVTWADEILLADSGSTDRTMEIGREFGARVVERAEYVNYADMNNWAMARAAHDWVFILDTDERCTPALRDAILAELEAPRYDAYWMRRQNYFLGQEIRYGGWQNDRETRLLHRPVCRFAAKQVHAPVIVDTGRLGSLEGRIVHHTYRSFTEYFEKYNRYTTWAARDLLARGRRPGMCNLVLRPLWRFFKMYVVRGGFLDGKAGFLMCTLGGFSVFGRYLKLWSLTQAPIRKSDPDREP